ncbi:MAG: orotidine-5'-phosphate decarboxylase [Aquificae bacterium]|nr:orotidine-5'-phosphate decarboxylase [Aquificota bacterium]
MKRKPKLCVALDVPYERAVKLVRDLFDFFESYPLVLKVGHLLYAERGGDAVRELKDAFPYEVFLDLKFHDIPSVVAKAVEKASELGADYATLHLLGGPEMVREAVKAKGERLKLLGVSLLTSHDESYPGYIKSGASLEELVLHLAREGLREGVDGIVCSGRELPLLRKELGKEFIAVVPGVRVRKDRSDQKRVISPAEAVKLGADLVVIGREITQSTNPVYVVERALKLMGVL